MTETITIFAAVADTLSILAQSGLEIGIAKTIGLLRIIAYILAIGALIISGILFGQGRVESAIYGVVAAGILALSGSIVKFVFDNVDNGADVEIPGVDI